MRLERLRLVDYRNISAADLRLDAQFTVLWGRNGAGKTNVLEAIYFVSTLRSFRTSDVGHLIRHEASGTRVDLWAHDPVAGLTSNLSVRLERTAKSARRTAQLDGKTVRAAKDFYGRLGAVLFTPEDLGVLRGSPSGRRQFLDRVLFARERTHITDVQDYEKVLRSRNRVLKSEPGELEPSERARLLDTYDEGLSQVGARIWTRRADLLEELTPGFAENFRRIHHPDASDGRSLQATTRATMRYAPRVTRDDPSGMSEPHDVPTRAERLRTALAERRRTDLQRRSTTIGPHLDELEVRLDGALAGEFASQGQARALVLAFKIAELQAAHARRGAPPLLLLDDVTSELDPQRNAQLFETLGSTVGQCILTTTAAEFIRLPSGVDRRDVCVQSGQIGAVETPASSLPPADP